MSEAAMAGSGLDITPRVDRDTGEIIEHRPMTIEEARAWKSRVGSHSRILRGILQEGFDGSAWLALGYPDWTACLQAMADEFGLSERHMWNLHSANQTEILLLNHGSVGDIPERQLRPLADLDDPDKVLAWKTVIETAPGGKVTAGHVEAVAETLRELRDTGMLDIGDELAIPASQVIQAKLTEEAHERMQRQRLHIDASQRKKAHVANNSGEFEWYTPPALIEAAREAMGSIDCDPATSEKANETVKAATIYTLDNSGLDADSKWTGNVWMNPPYARPLIEDFAARLLTQLWEGCTTQACVLVNNATETYWFQSLLKKAAAVCFLKGRVTFVTPQGEQGGTPLQGQAVLYFGEEVGRFARTFSEMGKTLYVR